MKHLPTLLIATVLVACAFADSAQAQRFLSYEPETVELEGRLVVQSKYGPPNYGEDPKTDEKVRIPVLVLRDRVSVLGKPGDIINEPPAYSVRQIQLSFFPPLEHKHLIGRQVVVTGTLFHAHTGHHYTDVVMKVGSIQQKPVGYDLRQFDICRINTSQWFRSGGGGTGNLVIAEFRAPVGEDATKKSFKHSASGLIVNVAVEHQYLTHTKRSTPYEIRIALSLSKTEEDALDGLDKAEAGTEYKPAWGGLYVRKQVAVGDVEHTFSLYCFDKSARWYKQMMKWASAERPGVSSDVVR